MPAVHLTIESVEASPDKLVVVSDFVDNSSKTAHTVLHHLETGKRTISFVPTITFHKVKTRFEHGALHITAETKSAAHRHSIFDDELHEVFFNSGEKSFTRVLHQRNHKLQDLCHITDDHEVVGSLEGTRCESNYREALTDYVLTGT